MKELDASNKVSILMFIMTEKKPGGGGGVTH